MDQQSLPADSVIGREPSFEDMLATLANLQGGAGRKHPLDVMEREVQILGSKVREMAQARRLKMTTLRKKLESCQEEAGQELPAAQSFLMQLQKNLQQSKRECQKRMDKLQRERLQRDIEINSIVDEHVLEIAEHNESNGEIDQAIEDIRGRMKEIRDRVQLWRMENSKQLGQMELQLSGALRKNREEQYRQEKTAQVLLLNLKKRLLSLEQTTKSKLRSISEERSRSERSVIAELDVIIGRWSK